MLENLLSYKTYFFVLMRSLCHVVFIGLDGYFDTNVPYNPLGLSLKPSHAKGDHKRSPDENKYTPD